MSKTQSWIETADQDLYPHNGSRGFIQEVRQDMANRAQREEDNDKYNRRTVAIVGLLGTAVPLVLKVLELFHVIPK